MQKNEGPGQAGQVQYTQKSEHLGERLMGPVTWILKKVWSSRLDPAPHCMHYRRSPKAASRRSGRHSTRIGNAADRGDRGRVLLRTLLQQRRLVDEVRTRWSALSEEAGTGWVGMRPVAGGKVKSVPPPRHRIVPPPSRGDQNATRRGYSQQVALRGWGERRGKRRSVSVSA